MASFLDDSSDSPDDQSQSVNDWQTVPPSQPQSTQPSTNDWQTVPPDKPADIPQVVASHASAKPTQAQFLIQLKSQAPELKGFSDDDVMNRLYQLRPDLKTKIQSSTANIQANQAAIAKNKADIRSRSIVNPDIWKDYPTLAQYTKSGLGALPGVGAVLGGLAATPETLGLGTIAGAALGTGAGRGAEDLITQGLGLDYTTPLQKAGNIGMDTALAAVVPGVGEAILNPISSLRTAAGMTGKTIGNFVPSILKPHILDALEAFSKGGTKVDPLVRPPWQVWEQMDRANQPLPPGQGEFPFMEDPSLNQRMPTPSPDVNPSIPSDTSQQRELPFSVYRAGGKFVSPADVSPELRRGVPGPPIAELPTQSTAEPAKTAFPETISTWGFKPEDVKFWRSKGYKPVPGLRDENNAPVMVRGDVDPTTLILKQAVKTEGGKIALYDPQSGHMHISDIQDALGELRDRILGVRSQSQLENISNANT